MQVSTPKNHADVFGSPGARVRLFGLIRLVWPLFAITAACGYLLHSLLPCLTLSSTQTGIALIILAIVLGISVRASGERLQSFLKGARGEEEVGRYLSFLPKEVAVFHGLPSPGLALLAQGGRDLDHVVVGPTGIFLVETKNWLAQVTVRDGRILCDGNEPSRQPVEQVKSAAARLTTRLRKTTDLTLDVQPVVCFLNSALQGGTQGITGVIACNADELNRVIMERTDASLDTAALGSVRAILRGWTEGEQHA